MRHPTLRDIPSSTRLSRFRVLCTIYSPLHPWSPVGRGLPLPVVMSPQWLKFHPLIRRLTSTTKASAVMGDPCWQGAPQGGLTQSWDTIHPRQDS